MNIDNLVRSKSLAGLLTSHPRVAARFLLPAVQWLGPAADSDRCLALSSPTVSILSQLCSWTSADLCLSDSLWPLETLSELCLATPRPAWWTSTTTELPSLQHVVKLSTNQKPAGETSNQPESPNWSTLSPTWWCPGPADWGCCSPPGGSPPPPRHCQPWPGTAAQLSPAVTTTSQSVIRAETLQCSVLSVQYSVLSTLCSVLSARRFSQTFNFQILQHKSVPTCARSVSWSRRWVSDKLIYLNHSEWCFYISS